MPNATDKKAVFFADLDGTLIFSRRHGCSRETLWIEYLNGKPLSYIPKRAFEALKNLSIEIVPVTSRNPDQLSRLTGFLKELNVRRALLDNGSDLINLFEEEDAETKRFNSRVREECEPYLKYMEKALEALSGIPGIRKIYSDLPCFISGASDSAEQVYELLEEGFADSNLRIYSEKRRVYISPDIITKGSGVKRFCDIFNVEYKICAGDSENDISMLEAADLCFCPEETAALFEPSGERIICGGFFADGIASELNKRMWLK